MTCEIAGSRRGNGFGVGMAPLCPCKGSSSAGSPACCLSWSWSRLPVQHRPLASRGADIAQRL